MVCLLLHNCVLTIVLPTPLIITSMTWHIFQEHNINNLELNSVYKVEWINPTVQTDHNTHMPTTHKRE